MARRSKEERTAELEDRDDLPEPPVSVQFLREGRARLATNHTQVRHNTASTVDLLLTCATLLAAIATKLIEEKD